MGPLEVVGVGDGSEAETAIFTAGAPLVDWDGRFLLVVGAGSTGLACLLPVLSGRIDIGRWV